MLLRILCYQTQHDPHEQSAARSGNPRSRVSQLVAAGVIAAVLSGCQGQPIAVKPQDAESNSVSAGLSTQVASPAPKPSAGGMVIETITMPPDMPAADAGQLIEGQIRYLDEIRKNAVPVPDSKAALRDADLVCDMVGLKGFRATTEALNKQNPSLGVEDLMFVTTSAIYNMCPNRSPFGPSVGPPADPPAGKDGEFLTRSAKTGLQLNNFPDAVQTAQQVCAMTTQGASLLEAANYVSSVSPRSADAPTVGFAVTAIEVYCPRG